MKKKLLLLLVAVFSLNFVSTTAQVAPIAPPAMPGKVISGAELKTIPFDVVKMQTKQSRSLEDGVQEPKWLTNLPLDSTIYQQNMVGYETDCYAYYSTLLRTDLVSKFVGNKATTLKTFLPDCGTSVYFWIMDANTGETLWSSDVYDGYTANTFVDVPCDYEIKEVRNLQVGMTIECIARKDYYLAIQPCYRDMAWLIASNDPSMNAGMTYDYSTYRMMIGKASTYMGLPFYLITEGDAGLKQNGIEISGITTSRVLMGEEADFTANFVNYGCMPIKKISFESRLGSHTTTVEHNMPVPYLGSGSFPMNITTDEAAERREVRVKLISINGETPTETIEAKGSIIAIDPNQSVERNVVMEEFTGTWCGWCPRGMVGMELLAEEYGDKFIPIGVHYNDNMQDASFNGVLGYATGGFPSSILNRIKVADPYLGTSGKTLGIDANLQEIYAIPTEATIAIDHAQVAEDRKSIVVTSSANFTVSCEECPYMMSYVLTEDGIEGVQTNYYAVYASQYANEPNLGFLTKEKQYWKTTFNHVGRYVHGELGIEGSLSGVIVPGEAKKHTTEIPVPSNISNLSNVHLVALLLDKTSGEIVNATSVKLGETTAVDNVLSNDDFATVAAQAGCLTIIANSAVAHVYSADGSLVGKTTVNGVAAMHLDAGNYVVRISNGKDVVVKKVAL